MNEFVRGYTATGARVHLLDTRVSRLGVAVCGTHVMAGTERLAGLDAYKITTCARCRRSVVL